MAKHDPIEMSRDESLKIYRQVRVAKEDFQDDNTFQVKMSSEFPGEQRATKEHEKLGIAKEGEKYTEILSHEQGDVDLSRFVGDNRAALLDEHMDHRHLGYIKTAALSEDKCTRGVVVFDNISKLSKTRCKEVRAESRPNFSIGYQHTKYLGPQDMGDGKIGHRFAWAGLELSNVSVPMDPTARKGRSGGSDCHCIRCGDPYTRKSLNEDFVCSDCADAEDSGDDSSRGAGERMFRMKSKDADGKDSEFCISHNAMREKVRQELDGDKVLKIEDDKGNKHSDYYLHDIHQTSADAKNFQAIVQHPAWKSDAKHYAIDFTYDGTSVQLGDHTEVEPKLTFEAVDRSLPFDAKTFRKTVDSTKLATSVHAPQILTRSKIMPEANTPTATPELVIDGLNDPRIQRAIKDKGFRASLETEAQIKDRDDKLAARNTEIRALAADFAKEHGALITYRKLDGGKKEALYVRDGIALAALEACATDGKPDSEVRQIFRSKVDDLKRDAVKEENIKRAMDSAEDGLSGKCGDMFEVNKKVLARAHAKGERSTALMPDGAELEYTDERKSFYRNMPGSGHLADFGGFFTPPNKGRAVSDRMGRSRLQRDALAGDFASAGAMIAPQFQPYIQLLRNKILLNLLGCTYIGGCAGEQVFPRQEAATVAQSVPEGGALATYDQTLGQIKMSPHRVGSRQYYSRLALIQAPPDFESMVWNDHANVLALYQDEMGIIGTGAADQPLGILNQSGITQLIFGGTPTYSQIINFRTSIRKFNINGPLAFATTSVGQGRLAFLPAALNGSTVITQGEKDAIWAGDEIDGQILGSKAVATQQIPGDILLAGVWENLILASWGGIFTILDNYTRAANDEVAITFNTYFDIAVRHAQAFCKSLDSCNQ
jgi:HK97 family phage major capsid protein